MQAGRCMHLVPLNSALPPRCTPGCPARPRAGSADSRCSHGQLQVCSVAQLARSISGKSSIMIDNKSNDECTVVSVEGTSRANLMAAVTTAFRDLGIDVKQASQGLQCQQAYRFQQGLTSGSDQG